MTLSISAIVLAGGRAERLGGRNKGLLAWPNVDSPPLIEAVAQRLAPQVSEILVSANAERDHYAPHAKHVVKDDDDLADMGPLAGIASAGAEAKGDLLLIAPVDCPRLPLDLAQRLHAGLGDKAAAVADDGSRLHPLAMLMRRDRLGQLRDYLKSGGRSAHGWLEYAGLNRVHFADSADAFININQPADFHYLP